MRIDFQSTCANGSFPAQAFAPYQAAITEALDTLRCRLVLGRPNK